MLSTLFTSKFFSLQMAIEKKIVVITAPSGAGKTSITKHLLQTFHQLAFSISAATRPQRTHEVNGKDYYFISTAEFKEKINRGEFVEWEMVYEGKYYGTLKSELERIWSDNHIPVLDIDVKGAIHVQQQFPGNLLSIFIDPPSVKELERRLQSRGTETKETLQARVSKASFEISFKHHFNKIIVNDHLENACKAAEIIVKEFMETSI